MFNRTEGRQDPVGSGVNEYETSVLNNVEMYANSSDPYNGNSWQKGSVVSSAAYNALSKPYDVTLGNGLLTSYRYWGIDYVDPYNVKRNHGLLYSIVAGSLQDLTYDYDPKGNVTSLGDGRNGETISFGYDHLDGLISASAPLNESYGYDIRRTFNGPFRTAANTSRRSTPTPITPRPYNCSMVRDPTLAAFADSPSPFLPEDLDRLWM